MKKYISIISAAILLGSMMLLGGCNKSPFSHKGELITFGTASGGAVTRTQYGDDFTSGGKNYQSIDWNTGDMVRVISPEAAVTNNGSDLHYADYRIVSATNTTGVSEGKVENVNGNGLAWTGKDTYSFYAVFPSTTPISLEDATYGQVTADFIKAEQTLPSSTTTKTVGEGEAAIEYTVYTPDIKSAVMTAVATGVKENDEQPQVKLHFKPAWTAVEFNLSSQDDDIAVTEVQLVADAESNDYLAGPFTMTAGNLASAAVTTADASKTVTMTMENVTVTKTEGATFTMLLLPVANENPLTLRLTSTEGEGTKTSVVTLTRTVDGDKMPFIFEPGKKYRINALKAPGSSWKIFIATDILNVEEWGDPVDTTLIVE